MNAQTFYPALGLFAQRLAEQVSESKATVDWSKLVKAVGFLVNEIRDDAEVLRLVKGQSHLQWVADLSLPFKRREMVIEQEAEGLYEMVELMGETSPENEAILADLQRYYAGLIADLDARTRATVVAAVKGLFLTGKRKGKGKQQPGGQRRFEMGCIPEAGMIAWVTIPKADGDALKQAKCMIDAVEGEAVTVVITKTGAQYQRVVGEIFDHVPHLVDGQWV